MSPYAPSTCSTTPSTGCRSVRSARAFIVRVKFQRLDHEELFYAPKDRVWRPPADYDSARGEIAKGLALPAVARDETGAILPRETAKHLSKAKFPEGSRALLRQAPHDWFVELDLRCGEPPDRAGLPVKKNYEWAQAVEALETTRLQAGRPALFQDLARSSPGEPGGQARRLHP